jgi:AcrR family transcriptional regulator
MRVTKIKKEQSFKEIYIDILEKKKNLTDKQKAVLQAALELFSEQGFDGTSSQQIADKAGVSVGAVYRKFPDKQSIMLAVLSPIFEETMTLMSEQLKSNSFDKGFSSLDNMLLTIITNHFNFIHDNIHVIRLLLEQVLTNRLILEQVKQFFGNQIKTVVFPALEKFKSTNQLVDLSNDYIVQLIYSQIISYAGKLILNIENLPKDKEILLATNTLKKVLNPNDSQI